jgi:hypothetical protein
MMARASTPGTPLKASGTVLRPFNLSEQAVDLLPLGLQPLDVHNQVNGVFSAVVE